MKILFYLDRYPGYGGIEKVTTFLANYFIKEKSWEVKIISHKQQFIDDFKGDLQRNAQISFMPNSTILSCEENKIFFNDIVKEGNFNYIIFQDSYTIPANMLKSLNVNVPVIVVEHNTPDCQLKSLTFDHQQTKIKSFHSFCHYFLYWYHFEIMKVKQRIRHRELYQLCDKYVLLSDSFIHIFREISCLKDTNKLRIINNPLTVNDKTEINTENKKKEFLFVARLDAQKGINLLLEIWSKLNSKLPDWILRIVGDGIEQNYIKSYIKDKGLNNVILEGYQTNLSKYYIDSPLFLMTSIYEGWGLTLVEAMFYGCIPIAFESFESVNDIIDNGINGLLIKPFLVKEYSDAVIKIINNVSQLHFMAEHAKNKASLFKINKIGSEWVDSVLT